MCVHVCVSEKEVCVCACAHTCVHARTKAQACACLWRPDIDVWCLLYFLGQDLSLN